MTSSRRLLGGVRFGGVVALVLLVLPEAHAAGPDLDTCATASEDAQLLRIRSKLREARTKFIECARESCPALVRQDCAHLLEQVDASLPSIVVTAHDVTGAEMVDVRVRCDDDVLAELLDGHAISVDPGVRAFRFEAKGRAPIEERLTIREGEKNRPIHVTFDSAEPQRRRRTAAEPASNTPPSGPGRPAPVLAIATTGLAALALGSWAYFGLSTRSSYDDLADTCSPNCSATETDRLRTRALVADVSLGVGVIAAGLAAVLWLTSDSTRRAAPAPISRLW